MTNPGLTNTLPWFSWKSRSPRSRPRTSTPPFWLHWPWKRRSPSRQRRGRRTRPRIR